MILPIFLIEFEFFLWELIEFFSVLIYGGGFCVGSSGV